MTTAEIAALQKTITDMSTRYDEMVATITSLEGTVTKNNDDTIAAMSHTWLLICGALVMFMHAGFAMLESGCCRQGFVQSVLEKNLLNCCVSTVGWWVFGWALAYGNVPDGGFGGSEEFFSLGFLQFGKEVDGVYDGGIIDPAVHEGGGNLSWFFQWAFCMTAATIVSGAVAERLQLGGYCIFCFCMTTVVYPIVVAWTWSCTGWLNKVGAGYMDFAGSGIVHLTGGMGALVCAAIVGPRKGRFQPGVDQSEFEPHNVAFIVLGTIILWFGWYGFNCGSTLGMSEEKGRLAAQVAVNTTLAPAVAGLVATFFKRVSEGKWSTPATCGGILGGLVSITAGCGSVQAWSAVLIGFIGGFVYLGASALMPKIKVDDPVEAFPVHGACGIWGVLAAAIFDWGNFMDGRVHAWYGFAPYETGGFGDLFLANLVGVVAIMAWAGFWLAVVFKCLKMAGLLRISAIQEAATLDSSEFNPKEAYSPKRAMLDKENGGNNVKPWVKSEME